VFPQAGKKYKGLSALHRVSDSAAVVMLHAVQEAKDDLKRPEPSDGGFATLFAEGADMQGGKWDRRNLALGLDGNGDFDGRSPLYLLLLVPRTRHSCRRYSAADLLFWSLPGLTPLSAHQPVVGLEFPHPAGNSILLARTPRPDTRVFGIINVSIATVALQMLIGLGASPLQSIVRRRKTDLLRNIFLVSDGWLFAADRGGDYMRKCSIPPTQSLLVACHTWPRRAGAHHDQRGATGFDGDSCVAELPGNGFRSRC